MTPYCEVKSAYNSGGPAIRLELIPPPWNARPSQGYPQHYIKAVSTHLCTWVERGSVGIKSLAKEHNTIKCSWLGIKQGLSHPQLNTLTMRPPYLHTQKGTLHIALIHVKYFPKKRCKSKHQNCVFSFYFPLNVHLNTPIKQWEHVLYLKYLEQLQSTPPLTPSLNLVTATVVHSPVVDE